jgi:hypothetical protein
MRRLRVELQRCSKYNEKVIKTQEEKNQLNASMLQSLIGVQRQMHHGESSNNVDRSKNNSGSFLKRGLTVQEEPPDM